MADLEIIDTKLTKFLKLRKFDKLALKQESRPNIGAAYYFI
jgi:hypothetical protein